MKIKVDVTVILEGVIEVDAPDNATAKNWAYDEAKKQLSLGLSHRAGTQNLEVVDVACRVG